MATNNNSFAILASAGMQASIDGHPNPWIDMASRWAPQNMFNALGLCEFIYLRQPTFREASRRILNYFLTKPRVSGGDERERKKFQRVLEKDFKLMDNLKHGGEDFMCYGNLFASMFLPFTRVLKCRQCSSERDINRSDFKFDIANFVFHSECPKCRCTQPHTIKDYPNRDPKKIKLVRWDPKQMVIEPNRVTGECRYWFKIPGDEQKAVEEGNRFLLSTLPLSYLVAIKRKQMFKFNPDYFYHLKEPCLSGVDLKGWGIPTIMVAFPSFFRLQVMYRHDEVLMMDYIVPLRLLSPKQGSFADGNTIQMNSMRNWVNNMGNMIQKHRVDGADWNFVPFPTEYQAVGGEGQALSPKDLIQLEEDRLLNARGIPPELYRGTLTLQVAPIALRLFERSWSTLVHGFNDIADWSAKTIARYMNSGDFDTELESVTVADDLDAKMWRLQAMAGGIISKETGLNPMGLDAREEYRKILDQQTFEMTEQQKADQDMQMKQLTLDAPQDPNQGGAQQAAGGASPMDVEGNADAIARQLLTLPETEKNQQLAQYRQTNSTLHAVILKKMDQLRNQARGAGMGAGLQQVLSQGGVAAPMPEQANPGGQ